MIPLEPFNSVIRWQDIVDILLNTYILFRLYVLFRGTHVMRVVAGIAFLWLFQRVATQAGLVVTSWFLQGITAAAALIIIVVFRNEIRNVLQAQNLRAVLWGFPRKNNTKTPVDILTESVSELSRRRIGALIVVPGKDEINELVQGGVDWQGLISKEMLLSVFWNGNPIHDGAVVVEGNRITRVGTILPLSQRQDIPKRYGTRHRAALGLAQNTDAMVIVVSEETGNIILADGDEIIDIHDSQVLRYNLRRHLGIGRTAAKEGKRATLELAAAGLVCLVCMTGIWFSFTTAMDTIRVMEVPVEFTNRKADLEIFGTSASNIDLYIVGSGPLMKNMRPDQVKVAIDVGQSETGTHTFNLSSKNVSLPPGIRLNLIEPDFLTVNLDKLVVKRVPVQVDWVGRPPEGMQLKSVRLSPSTIRLVGPSRQLEPIDTVYTEQVDISMLRDTGTAHVKPILGSASVRVAQGESDRIEIRYVMGERDPI